MRLLRLWKRGLGIEEETGNRQFDAELHRLLGSHSSGLKRLEESGAVDPSEMF